MKKNAQELQQFIESADSAINREDFDGLMNFYSDGHADGKPMSALAADSADGCEDRCFSP
jgi:ketosteroid isomerase-like protein